MYDQKYFISLGLDIRMARDVASGGVPNLCYYEHLQSGVMFGCIGAMKAASPCFRIVLGWISLSLLWT